MARPRVGKRGPTRKQSASSTLKRTSKREEECCKSVVDDNEDCNYNSGVGEDEEDAPLDSVEISGESSAQGTSLSSISDGLGDNQKMSVVQKSNLLNWVDEFFSRHNKVMLLSDLEGNLQLHLKICREINVPSDQWTKYKKDALLTIKSQITERMSSHRKSVHLLYKAYLSKHRENIQEYCICEEDFGKVFRTTSYGASNDVMKEKWKLIGDCMVRVCSKHSTWRKLSIRAEAEDVSKFVTVAEEAVVYWLFTSEGKDWVEGFRSGLLESGEGNIPNGDNKKSRKKKGAHKTREYRVHYAKIVSIVAENRKSSHSRELDKALQEFAIEEIIQKENKKKRKRDLKSVIPSFDKENDVLGLSTSSAETLSLNLVIETDENYGWYTQGSETPV